LQGGEGVVLKDDPEIEEMLQRRDQAEPGKREYDFIERWLKKRLVPGQDFVCGDYVVTWKEIDKQIKAVEAHTRTEHRKKIVCVKPDEKAGMDVA
jgi:hypothetical protein